MLRLLLLILGLFAICGPAPAAASTVRLVFVDGPINPVTVSYLHRNLAEAATRGEQLVLVEMDTPGGLDSAMRAIVKDILASPVPVVVYVTPAGARAASAGAVITLAADVAAMTPGTNIGAAHPVTVGGDQPDKTMQEKMVNDAAAYVEGIARRRGRNPDTALQMVRESVSLPADRALASGLVDLLAANRDELLQRLDGRAVNRNGSRTILHVAGAVVTPHPLGTRERILDTISNPNVAYILLMLGFLGIFFELSTPGAILPGVIGGIALILAFFAFQTLPVNYAGVLLILLGLILFIAEIKVVSHGMLAVGGVVAMVFGSLLLFPSSEPYLRVSWGVIGVTVATSVGFCIVVVTKAIAAHRRRPTTGREGMIGEQGTADSAIDPQGKVLLRGEYWSAWSDEPIAAGTAVEVVAVEGLRVKVKAVKGEP